MNKIILISFLIVGNFWLPTNSFCEDMNVILNSRAIEVIQKKEGVYFYIYPETIEPIDPQKDFIKKYKLYNQTMIENLNQLILSNKEYKPEFTARCLPVWDYGLEFRYKKESHFFLFSFRCNTIKYVNENLFKDFSPQSIEFYKIFKYEIDENNSLLLEQKSEV